MPSKENHSCMNGNKEYEIPFFKGRRLFRKPVPLSVEETIFMLGHLKL